MSFLDDFFSRLHLTEDDKKMLEKKRGFHDLTISTFDLKSCGLYIKEVASHFKDTDLIKNKIMDSSGNINPQLLRNNIIIPYKNRHGLIEKIRPHKLGFKNDIVMPFCDMYFDRKADYVILTEGEFKAIAGYQYGLNTIAIPGISVFCKNLYPDLISFLSNSEVKHIFILFDREIKDNPDYENFKPDWKNRYDTELYSYVMAIKLKDSGFITSIAEFPTAWMENGKADFDSVLAQQIPKDQIKSLLKDALKPEDYLNVLKKRMEDLHWQFLERKIKNAGRKRNIIRWANKYFIPTEDDDSQIDRPISNFTIDITATYFDKAADQIKREIVITNEFGDRTKPRIIDPVQMSSVSGFKTFCYSQGNFMYYGNEKNLMEIWESEFASDEGNSIYEIDHIGRIDIIDEFSKQDMWITKNILFCEDQEIHADDNGIFWVGDKGIRYLNLDTSNDSMDTSICQTPEIRTQELDLKEVCYHMTKLVGESGKLLIGWAVFSLIRPYLKRFNDVTPYPFLYGEKQTGKTTACQILMGLFGLPDFGTTFTDITKVAITRLMAYYSYIPVWIDEFSNDHRVQSYEPHLKSVYNRMPVMKGTRSAFGLASYPIRSGLLMSGETIPTMDAVKQRSVLLPMRIDRSSSASLRWLENNKKELSYFTYHVIKNRRNLAKEADAHISKYYDAISDLEGIDDIRIPKHFSLFAGCYKALMPEADASFNKWMVGVIDKQKVFTKNDETFQFFEDMTVLYVDRTINDNYVAYEKIDGHECGVFWFNGIYDKWKEKYGKVKEIHAKESLRESMRSRNYFWKEKRTRVKGEQRPCIIIKLDDADPTIKDFFQSLATETYKLLNMKNLD